MIQSERVRALNSKPENPSADYVLYWMQASQRAECNHALEYAVERANGLQKPLAVFFGLTPDFPEANERHYAFMLRGLAETAKALEKRGIPFVARIVQPEKGAIELSRSAALVVCDRGYLKIQKSWRGALAKESACSVVQVESDAVVPVETASTKDEYSAATLRPKIHAELVRFLVPLRSAKYEPRPLRLAPAPAPAPDAFDPLEPERALAKLKIDCSVPRSAQYKGGRSAALRLLDAFLETGLARYAEDKNDPGRAEPATSLLSPYLHFGQISALEIALAVRERAHKQSGRSAAAASADVYLEELIVRRELSINFCRFNEKYDDYDGLPPWCRRTLDEHAKDKRDFLYQEEQWDAAATHDRYWNAAQLEMKATGRMHGYMRMYWGKKILEWTRSPREAHRIALKLNNRYELDGRDPNGYAGVAWCLGKHDRPWGERKVFGLIRYMNAAGLKRKFDVDAYAACAEDAARKCGMMPKSKTGTSAPPRELF